MKSDNKDSLGLKRGSVSLSDFSSSWKNYYNLEKDILKNIFGSSAIAIEHVGSTAIPNMKAKPIIDIIVGFKKVSDYKQFVSELTKAGYEYMPERIEKNRAFFPKGSRDRRTHHLSIVEYGGAEWENAIYFRDKLSASSELAGSYMQLKLSLAETYSDNRLSYTLGKDKFINKHLRIK